MSRSRSAQPIRFVTVPSSLGSVLVACSDRGISAVLLGDDPAELATEVRRRFPGATSAAGDSAMAALARRVVDAVESPASGSDLPLDLQGTDFQRAVWDALRAIPAGTTSTYAAIASRIGRPRAVRAVGLACGANHVAVLVPCHRVVRGDGALSGYRWGVERKRALLERERAG
jgi:AraC family transcriptional regulator of adaptative response/methylated-DNA-[protein]-cysteine methyltransferase